MRLIGLNSWLRGSLIKAPSLTPPMRRGRGAYRIEKGVTMCSFLQKSCMSLLAYFVERASLCAIFAKNACPRWPTLLKGRHYMHFLQKPLSFLTYPIGKGVPMCIFRKKSACPRWSTLLKRALLCAFCFANKTHVLVGLPC